METTKNLQQIEGFINRNTHGLPGERCAIKVLMKDIGGETIYLCEWRPFKENEYDKDNMPSAGYLGTAKVIEGKYNGIGFHAWDQNNSEFIYYSIVT